MSYLNAIHAELEAFYSAVGLKISEVDTTPTPDTIFNDFQAFSAHTDLLFFESFTQRIANFRNRAYYRHEELGPANIAEVNTTPTPDTIFVDFQGFGRAEIPFYPDDTTLAPGDKRFVGDAGAYIG